MSENEQIEGVGKEIEIDESKFGKRKYHRGKRLVGVGVLVVLSEKVRNASLKLLRTDQLQH